MNFNTLNRQAKCMFFGQTKLQFGNYNYRPSQGSSRLGRRPQSPGVRKSVFVQLGITIVAAYVLLRFSDRPVSNWVRQPDGRSAYRRYATTVAAFMRLMLRVAANASL